MPLYLNPPAIIVAGGLQFKGYPTDSMMDNLKTQGLYYAGNLTEEGCGIHFWGTVLVFSGAFGTIQILLGNIFAWRIYSEQKWNRWTKVIPAKTA